MVALMVVSLYNIGLVPFRLRAGGIEHHHHQPKTILRARHAGVFYSSKLYILKPSKSENQRESTIETATAIKLYAI
jgi:hypothetical protein